MSLVLQLSTQQDLLAARAGSLCRVWHGDAVAQDADVIVPLAALRTPAGEGLAECWRSAGEVLAARHGAANVWHDGELMFVAVDVEADAADIVGVTRRSYEALFAAMHAAGYLHLVRCWNYVPGINENQFDAMSGEMQERYRLFNLARQDAFRDARQAFEHGAPAACALGSHRGGLTVYALAARGAPLSIENPRQVSAYHYPAQYGPRSPSFSRAAMLGDMLFVSGTASIVGHESLHIGDLIAQTEESLRNIDVVLGEANRLRSRGRFVLADLQFKVFVRHVADADGVANVLQKRLGEQARIDYLQADICRAELLVEIEAAGFIAAGQAG